MDENNDDENLAVPAAPCGARSRPGEGSENDDGKDEEDTQCCENGTGKENEIDDARGIGNGTRNTM
jgi:hypothetical protein